ncbi:hypothetical protein APHAL10511_007958 [Amanita phalloides]|nr:hypothetical protein APHAL10511_007958 [Amanita phalloides]
MANAKDCTISLRLAFTRAGSWAPESENNWRHLCNELLGRFIQRYHAISVHAPDFELSELGNLTHFFPGQVHSLRSVKLLARSAGCDDTISLFSVAPQLTRVVFGLLDGYVMDDSWSNISQYFRPSLLPLPWGQLTHCCIRMPVTLPIWYTLLPQLHSLEQCAITLDAESYGDSRAINLSQAPIILPNLTVLGLTLNTRDRPVAFHGVEMPQLNKLHLSSLFPMNVLTLQWQEHIGVLCNLSSFCLHRVGIDSQHLMNILGEMGRLQELILSCDLRDYDAILKALTVDEAASAPLVPLLQIFKIHVAFGRNNIQFKPETLVHMVRSRWWIPLTSVSVKRLHLVRVGVFGADPSLSELGTLLLPIMVEGLVFEMAQELTPFPYPSDEDITVMW